MTHDQQQTLRSHVIELLPDSIALCRLAPDTPLPSWCDALPFSSIARTSDELSIFCPDAVVPDNVPAERSWRALKLRGPFALNEIGVLVGLAQPLADHRISIMAVSTYDTDYILVNGTSIDAAIAVLEGAGHKVIR